MFRFTIRDLLWLMVVVGMAILWQAEKRERYRENSMDIRRENSELRRQLSQIQYSLDGQRQYINSLRAKIDASNSRD